MRTPTRIAALLSALALILPARARADHSFIDRFENLPCCGLDPDDGVRREIVLFGAGPFMMRDALVDFLDDPILPVTKDGDLELLWDNDVRGDGASLALTDIDDGTYFEEEVEMSTDMAFESTDLAGGMPHGGCVVRYVPSPQMFYAAYGAVQAEGGGLTIRLHLEKSIGGLFVPLDLGPALSAPTEMSAGQNFHLTLHISVTRLDGSSDLTASLERVTDVAGVPFTEHLADLAGTDDDLRQGYVGLYAAGGTLHTEVAFDYGHCVVSGITAGRGSTWGAIKSSYR